MSGLFDQIRQLHSDQLFTNLTQLVRKTIKQSLTGFVISVILNQLNLLLPQLESSSELFSPSNEYKVLIYYGDALYKTKDYRRAEVTII